MANAITRQVLSNGLKNYIVRYTITGDGSGEETASRINNVSGDMGTDNKIWKIEAVLHGFDAQVLWDATTDVVACSLPTEVDCHLSFVKQGGIINNAGTGKTGDLLLATAGLGAGDYGTIVVHVKKKSLVKMGAN